MKRLCMFLIAIMLCVNSMPLMANAVTPPLKVPNMPSIPNFSVKIDIPESAINNWIKNKPLPAIKLLNTPTIIEARYYHGRYSRLRIQWNTVPNAEKYEIKIVKADNTEITYFSKSNYFYCSEIECPRVYVEETSTWASATVRVRAIGNGVNSLWSDSVNIGCDALHQM